MATKLMTTLLTGVAVLSLGMSVPALAEVVHHRHVVRHARVIVVPRRAVRVVGPAKYVPLQPDEFVDPANPGYVHGVDDGSRFDTTADGIAAGTEGPVPGPRNVGQILPSTSARGYELEGPIISPTLPVVPELIDRDLY